MTNIFNMIKVMVNHNINEEYSNDGMFNTGIKMDTITCSKYPQGAIQWLINNKICTLDKVEIAGKGFDKKYIIKFKDFNLEHSFFKKEYRRTLLASQMMDYNDKTRQDFNRYYSQSRVDDEYYFQDEDRYEHLDKADSCTFDLYIQSLGFNNYEEFKKEQEAGNLDDKDTIEYLYRNFLERNMANEWQYGEEDEECLV